VKYLTDNYIKSSNIWFDGVHRKRCTPRTYSRIGDLEAKHRYVLKKFEIYSRDIGALKGMINQMDIKKKNLIAEKRILYAMSRLSNYIVQIKGFIAYFDRDWEEAKLGELINRKGIKNVDDLKVLKSIRRCVNELRIKLHASIEEIEKVVNRIFARECDFGSLDADVGRANGSNGSQCPACQIKGASVETQASSALTSESAIIKGEIK
jgi:hypothetical protein